MRWLKMHRCKLPLRMTKGRISNQLVVVCKSEECDQTIYLAEDWNGTRIPPGVWSIDVYPTGIAGYLADDGYTGFCYHIYCYIVEYECSLWKALTQLLVGDCHVRVRFKIYTTGEHGCTMNDIPLFYISADVNNCIFVWLRNVAGVHGVYHKKGADFSLIKTISTDEWHTLDADWLSDAGKIQYFVDNEDCGKFDPHIGVVDDFHFGDYSGSAYKGCYAIDDILIDNCLKSVWG